MDIQWAASVFTIVCLQYIAESTFWRTSCLSTGIQPTTPTIFSEPGKSAIECSIMCQCYDGCVTANFDQQNGICNGFGVEPENIVGNDLGNKNAICYTSVPEACLRSGWEWIESKKWCINITKESETKELARKKCLSEGADLVQLPTTESFQFFVFFMSRCWKDCNYLHVGANRVASGFKWHNGTMVGDMYCNGEPMLGSNDHCVYFTCPIPANAWCTYKNKRLDDAHCFSTSYVCIKYL